MNDTCLGILGGALLGLSVFLAGCGSSKEPALESAPFEQAVASYLDTHNMALAVREVKEGPVVEGDKATMTVSLTHAELGGASVTWGFKFERGADGAWKAVSHED